jgi:hypothetical protein
MNRSMLIKVLAGHVPTPFMDNDGHEWTECGCGIPYYNEHTWARHVASVIYPETVGSDTTGKTGEAA